MVNRRLVPLFVLCAFVAISSAAAQETELSLDDCLRMGLKNNLDLISARKDPEISAEAVNSQLGAFDANVNATLFASGFETEPSNEFTSAGIGKTQALRGQYTELFKFGADVDATLQTSRSNGAGTLFDIAPDPTIPDLGLDEPYYSTTLSVTFNMPLLRGSGKEPTTEFLLLAEGDLHISREELRRQTELTMETIEGAYWNVAAARRAVVVARESLDRAVDLLELNRKKVEVGTLAPIEITQAEAGVASQEEGVIVADEVLENAEDDLLRLLAVPADDPMWDRPIIPTDRPTFEAPKIDLGQAIEQAMTSRPEIATAQQDLRNRKLAERVAHNKVKHGLDLSFNWTPIGNSFLVDDLASPVVVCPPDAMGDPQFCSDVFRPAVGGVGDTYDELFESDFFNWQGSLTYSIPIGNRAAKATYRTATLTKEKSEIALENQKQTIRVEVRRAVRAVETGAKRVEAAATNVRLQKEKLDAEQKKFQNGMSTSFQVLEFQNDLSDAELAQIRAAVDYVKAAAALERVKGTLLEARGLSLAP